MKAITQEEKQKLILMGGCATLLLAIAVLVCVLLLPGQDAGEETSPSQSESSSTEQQTEETLDQTSAPETSAATEDTAVQTTAPIQVNEAEDPQNSSNGNMSDGSGAEVDISQTITQGVKETQEITFGIDVSKYQGTINWEQVAAAGTDYVMVRVGYRTLVSGEIVADTNARYNMQQAHKYGIKLGAYFFSTAITEDEAVQEANWVADYISQYPITYPVAYDCEGFLDPQNRQYGLSKTQRTDIALAFLKTIKNRGYTPMFYASQGELQNSAQWEVSRIDPLYKIWVAQYPAKPYPQTERSSYTHTHAMWQYTTNGVVPGISKHVDVNIAYFGYEGTEDAKNDAAPENAEADIEALMPFTQVNEAVTAKIATNLRSHPSQGAESKVLYTLKNGEIATRIGISDSGWSKLEYNGSTFYAVSSFLTTDLVQKPSVAPTEPETDPQIQTQFTPVNEQVTAKDVVNLRTLPSVTNENSTVAAQLHNGEVVTRTGINIDVGWSRVVYNGQVLYCISSYLQPAQETPPEETTEAAQ